MVALDATDVRTAAPAASACGIGTMHVHKQACQAATWQHWDTAGVQTGVPC